VKGYERENLHPKIIKALLPFRDGDFYTGSMDVLPALRAITADAAGTHSDHRRSHSLLTIR
jgi:hypothetical protein